MVSYKDINWYEEIKKYGIVARGKKQKKNHGTEVLDIVCAFDIETTTVELSDYLDSHAFMYVWQFAFEDILIIGRTWEEFLDFLTVLKNAINQYNNDEKMGGISLIIWVHNLAYEFCWLSGLYDFKNEECFFRDSRKPIYCRMYDCFEFRCSYIQTNLSLEVFTEQMKVKHKKLSGEIFDYNKKRFPWTVLSEYEIAYISNDVIGLVEAIHRRLEKDGDTLLTIPLTSTGYVRRECKKACEPYYLDILEMKPYKGENGEKIYRLLRKCFRGGNTHANRAFVGEVIDDVYSFDIVSSYPTQQLTKKFPMKPYKWIAVKNKTQADKKRMLEKVFMYIGLGYSVVGTYHFKGVELKNKKEPMPYISLGRCKALKFKLDNGRILYAEYLEISLTEIDLEIILEQYNYTEIELVECMIAQKDFLPEGYRKVIQEFYNNKTLLKGADTEEEQYLYMKSKNMLNSIYGMSATDPIHQEILYNGGDYLRSNYETLTAKEKEKALKNAPFPYQWGVYTTAYARKQLQDAIKISGENLLYCDTDSVKVKGTLDISVLNTALQKKAEQTHAYAKDKKGHIHYMGVFESDGHYKQFITQGAKRYAYLDDDNKMNVVVSGVTKKKNPNTGIKYAVEELQNLKRFKPGMIWEKAGGTISIFNDNDDFDYTDPESGKTVHVIKNVAIIPSTYKMSYSKDYSKLLNEISLYGVYQKERE